MKQKVREKVIAELLGVSERTVRNWRTSRIIPYTKVGRIILFDPEAVERALLKFERKHPAKTPSRYSPSQNGAPN